jgi:uncharacterized protein YegP (UPF0339 family)
MLKAVRRVVVPVVLGAVLMPAGLHLAVAQDKTKGKAAPATAVFEVYKDRGGEFRFRLKDGDGNLLAIAGKGYDTKADCEKVIEEIKNLAAKAKVEDMAK